MVVGHTAAGGVAGATTSGDAKGRGADGNDDGGVFSASHVLGLGPVFRFTSNRHSTLFLVHCLHLPRCSSMGPLHFTWICVYRAGTEVRVASGGSKY